MEYCILHLALRFVTSHPEKNIVFYSDESQVSISKSELASILNRHVSRAQNTFVGTFS